MKDDARLPSALPPGGSEVLCFKSWTAYVRPTVLAAIAMLIADIILVPLASPSLTFVVVVAIICTYSASVLSLQRERLMIDDEGVWYCRGGLGTKPRMIGVRWPYVRCSLSRPRVGWPRTSCTVVIRNRVTTREILVKQMARGDLAVARINSLQRRHMQRAR